MGFDEPESDFGFESDFDSLFVEEPESLELELELDAESELFEEAFSRARFLVP